MQIVTLEEAKERLSIDFNSKDNEILSRVEAIEGSLYFGTGIDFETFTDEKTKSVAKEYVLMRLYLDYYSLHSDINDLRLTQMMKQLQVAAIYAQ